MLSCCHSGLDPESRFCLICLDSRFRGNDKWVVLATSSINFNYII